MPLERPERLFVNCLQTAIFELDPEDEVGDGVEMEPGGVWIVPGPQEPPLIVIHEATEDGRSDGRQAETGVE